MTGTVPRRDFWGRQDEEGDGMAEADAVRRRPESVQLGVLLALAGGALDGIVFAEHGVFANAQTGNLVLFGIGVFRGRLGSFASLVPVVAFAAGTLVAHGLARERARVRRPTRVVLAAEVIVLVIVGLVPVSAPAWTTVLPVSFVAALQASTFRSLSGQGYSTTMSTGNLRLLVLSCTRAVADRDVAAARVAGGIGLVLLAFTAGAGAGALMARGVGSVALAAPAAVLAVVLALIVMETRSLERARRY